MMSEQSREEAIARIVDPEAWADHDMFMRSVSASDQTSEIVRQGWRERAAKTVERSLTKARQIIALRSEREGEGEPYAWTWQVPAGRVWLNRLGWAKQTGEYGEVRNVQPLYLRPQAQADPSPASRSQEQNQARFSGPAWIWAESADDFVHQVAGLMHFRDDDYEAAGDWGDDHDCLNALILRARQIRDQPLREVLAEALAAPPADTALPAPQQSEGE